MNQSSTFSRYTCVSRHKYLCVNIYGQTEYVRQVFVCCRFMPIATLFLLYHGGDMMYEMRRRKSIDLFFKFLFLLSLRFILPIADMSE